MNAFMSIRPDPFPQDKLQERVDALERAQRKDRLELKASRAVLAGIEAMTGANNRGDVLKALETTLKEAVGAREVYVIGDISEGIFGVPHSREVVLHPLRARNRLAEGTLGWFARKRLLPDLSRCRAPAPTDVSRHVEGSLISAPFHRSDGQPLAVLCWHPMAGFFDKSELALLTRIAPLVNHTLQGLRLDDRNALLASVLENAEVPVMLTDPADTGGTIVYVNPAYERISGRTLSDLMGRDFISDRFRQGTALQRLKMAFDDGQAGRFQIQNTRFDGTVFLDEVSLTPIRSACGALRYMLASHTDVTEQVQARETVQQLEERIETAMEAVSSAILVAGADSAVLYVNTAMHSLMHELYGRDMRPHQAMLKLCRSMMPGAPAKEVTCKDGTVFMLRSFRSSEGGQVITGTDVSEIKRAERELEQRAAAMDSTTEGIAIVERNTKITYANPAFAAIHEASCPTDLLGQPWCAGFLPEDVQRLNTEVKPQVEDFGSAQLEMRAEIGNEIRSFEVCVTRIDAQMRIVVARDITRRVQYESARANFEKKLHDFEKNESIGRLAAGVAHDFNNLLAVINGHSALLNERTPTDKVKLYADRIGEASSRAAKMINRFLDLGMSADTQSMIDLRNLVTESQDLLRSALSAETRFSLEMGEEEMEMLCYPSDLLRVALNLVQNAQDALMGRRGEIHQTLYRTTGTELIDRHMNVGTVDPDSNYACYAVRDSGSGIPDDVQRRLFREHCSTKGQRGSGIGMMAIAEIIRSHEGLIRLDSNPGAGTTVEIYLPLSDYAITRVSENELGAVRLEGQLVLLVDDDAQVAESMGAFLERLGAEVSICQHPDEALEAITEDPGMWSMLVSDYNMPGQNGGQLARAAKTVDDSLPIVIVTALARKLSDPNLNEDIVTALLGKPVDLNALAHLIAQHGRASGDED